jgi:saccharopine dehydrogenase-like NADP-dependent oxidoreductase
MKQILVLGAGLSSSALVRYLQQQAGKLQWVITIADANIDSAILRAANMPYTNAIQLQANDTFELGNTIAQYDIVLSLLPPDMHVLVAKACITYKKHLITASYVSDGMRNLHKDALKAGVLLLNEMGLDPGIDHMSAMYVIDEIKAMGGQVRVFRSYCGGLVAEEFDDNPWHYKFTWNPRNVVLAGKATAALVRDGLIKYIPPARIFKTIENISIHQVGDFDGYPNRDSLSYIKPYGIAEAHTVIRGTLRGKGFCEAWQLITELGLNDDDLVIQDAYKLTYRSWISAFVPGADEVNVESMLQAHLNVSDNDPRFLKLQWLGLFDHTTIPLRSATSAQILQVLLQSKWNLLPNELDMIVLQHQFEYTIGADNYTRKDNLVVKGDDNTFTAMAKTVGLPMAIATKHILNGTITQRGVHIPINSNIYKPVLAELQTLGISFTHHTELISE